MIIIDFTKIGDYKMKIFTYLNKSENSVSILLGVAILSMSYPYGFPLFGVIAIFFGVLKIVTRRFKIRINIGFIIFFLTVLGYMLGLSLSQGKIYSNNISDITNIISFFVIWALLSDLNKDNYPVLLHKFAKYAVFVSFIVATISLYKFYKLLGNEYLQRFYFGDFYPAGTSLVRDYNMFSFALIAGLIMSVYLLSQAKKLSHMFYFLIAFATIFTSVLFAGSRRGWIVAIIVAAFVLFLLIKFLVRFDKNLVKIIRFGLIVSSVAVFIYLLSILFQVDIDLENSDQIVKMQYRFETLKFNQAEGSFSERTMRWEYATQRYNESNIIQFLLGSGFDYLPDYAKKFSPNLQEDYPHNPFLSALLYSGLAGLVIILILFGWTIISAKNNIKTLGGYYTLLYFISWIFILVSANSIFSITLFVTLMLIIISVPSKQAPSTALK